MELIKLLSVVTSFVFVHAPKKVLGRSQVRLKLGVVLYVRNDSIHSDLLNNAHEFFLCIRFILNDFYCLIVHVVKF